MLTLLLLWNGHCVPTDGSGQRVEVQAQEPPVVRLVTFGGLQGALAPCECQPNMPGGLDHGAARIGQIPDPHLVVAAGSTFYEPPAAVRTGPISALGIQQHHKAESIAAALSAIGVAVLTPGLADLAAGGANLEALRQRSGVRLVAANLELPGVSIEPVHVVSLGTMRIGLTGIIAGPAARNAYQLGIRDQDMGARRGLAELAAADVDAKVLVVAGELQAARALAAEHPGFDAVIVGTHGASAGLNWPRWSSTGQWTARGEPDETWFGSAQGGSPGLLAPQPHGQELGVLRLAGAGALLTVEAHTEVVSGRYGSAPEVAEVIERYNRSLSALHAEHGQKTSQSPPGGALANHVGADTCLICHDAAHAMWNTTRHARAFWTLQERGKAADLECVGCHSTGAVSGGHAPEMPAASLRAVQCETCHGPGSRHSESGSREHIERVPLRARCRGCHRPPHVPANWDLERAWRRTLGPGHAARNAASLPASNFPHPRN